MRSFIYALAFALFVFTCQAQTFTLTLVVGSRCGRCRDVKVIVFRIKTEDLLLFLSEKL